MDMRLLHNVHRSLRFLLCLGLLAGCRPSSVKEPTPPAKSKNWCELLKTQITEEDVECFPTPGLVAAGNFGRKKNPLERTLDVCFDDHQESLKTILREEPAGNLMVAEAAKRTVGGGVTLDLTGLLSWLPKGSLKAQQDDSLVVSVILKDAKWRYISNLPMAFRTRLSDPALTPVQRQNLQDCQAYLCDAASSGDNQHVYVFKSLVAIPVIQIRSQKGSVLSLDLEVSGPSLGGGPSSEPASPETPLGRVKLGVEKSREGLVEISYESPVILAGGLDESATMMGGSCTVAMTNCDSEAPKTVRETAHCGIQENLVKALELDKAVRAVLSKPDSYELGDKQAELQSLSTKREALSTYIKTLEGSLAQCQDVRSECSPSMILPLPSIPLPKPYSPKVIQTLADALLAYKYQMGWAGGTCTLDEPEDSDCWSKVFNVVVVDNRVTMRYQHKEGMIEGTIAGNTLTGSWSQKESSGGNIVLNFSEDFESAVGWWNSDNYLKLRRIK